jgi:predicted Zn-dependent protease
VRSLSILCALAALLAACETAPVTGRSQMMLVGESEERQMGLQAYRDVLSKEQLSEDARTNALVGKVGRRIAAAAERPPGDLWRAPRFRWEFKTIDKDEPNAFCLPGGKVVVYTGILPITRTEAGLAVVIGHEVAHALARHGAERMSQEIGAQTIGQILALGVGQVSPGLQEDFLRVYGLGASFGVLLPWGRAQESEADQIGLTLMAKAGYDPASAIAFWERMSKVAGDKPPEFLSTHPSDQTRIAQIKAWLPEARSHYRGK